MHDIVEINSQHEKLMGTLNALNQALQDGEPYERIDRIIDEVISSAQAHFAFEESVMAHYAYPELKAHQDKHRQLLAAALKYKKKLRDVGERQFIEWLNHWPFAHMHAHILYADGQVEDYIRRCSGQR